MEASLRNLDIVYKGRDLNFKENEKLREAYLESVKESLDFGNKAQDFVKSLPTMTVSAAGGLTVFQALGVSGDRLWILGLLLAAVGYLINLLFVRLSRRQTQMAYLVQDYERGLYYDQYVSRVSLILTSLYLDLDRIHKTVFGQSYPVGDIDVSRIVEDMLSGVRPTFCKLVHRHMREKRVTPELWTLCETGGQGAIRKCPFWTEGEG